MGIALLYSGNMRFTDPEIIQLIKYLLGLQDKTNGGFKCNDTSDVYTWSNCNILMFLFHVILSINKMDGRDYTEIIADYYMRGNQ